MAEPRAVINLQVPIGVPQILAPEPERAAPSLRGPVPIWRSLLSPWSGQKALVLGESAPELFRLLRESGVLVERSLPSPRPVGGRGYDLILEARTGWRSSLDLENAAQLLAEEGRLIIALQGNRIVGPKGRWILRQLRRQGFKSFETFYAHASLWSPQVLVPLERHEPFEFFLRLTVGGPPFRRRFILTAYQLLGRLGIHRGFLPNCIVVARRPH